MVNSLKKALLITGIVVAIFASLMLFNFISSSISNKTKEIGILRAVGARGVDLFKIFFCESSVITIICIILAVIGSKLSCDAINESMANAANLVLLDFNIINILMIFIGAMVIAAIGTFIPVYIASKKQPVDSIRTL
jgi:ABC-type antimicrobial peptide transport system permease subunit